MFPKMRRANQELSAEVAESILADSKNLHGVLSMNSVHGYPYATPISFAWADGSIWIHTARAGHRLESLQADARVCFTVVDADETDEAAYTALFRSVIVFGSAHRVDSDEERRRGLKVLCDKYASHQPAQERERESSACQRSAVFRIDPYLVTGKAAR
jgi:nitroimidazol reductase NimA-like FMN-containing flavoprotein (pyridoxamine 5'-phosphate oxidase superfamily)